MEPRALLPATIDQAAAEIVEAHARILMLLRGRREPLSPAEFADLADLNESAEAWLRTLRLAVLGLVANERAMAAGGADAARPE